MNSVTDNEIAQLIDVADARARYDSEARSLVAQKSILAYILKSALDEFADIPVKQIAEEFIEGTPQVSETAVHRDRPDRAPSEKEPPDGALRYPFPGPCAKRRRADGNHREHRDTER